MTLVAPLALSLAGRGSATRDRRGRYALPAFLEVGSAAKTPGWSWGATATASFLPRVTRGRLVLSRAWWCLEADAWRSLVETPPARRLRRASELCPASWPFRHVLVQVGSAGDPLVLDLARAPARALRSLTAAAGSLARVTLREAFPDPGVAPLHELVIPLIARRPCESHGARPAL